MEQYGEFARYTLNHVEGLARQEELRAVLANVYLFQKTVFMCGM